MPIYEALGHLGVPPSDIEECELWQVAAMLGLDKADDRPRTEDELRAEANAMNAERVRAAEEGREPVAPEPSFGPVLTEDQADEALEGLRRARAERRRLQETR